MAYVQQLIEQQQKMQCAIELTANAKNSMLKTFSTEQAFFASEKNFHVFIEKKKENRQGNTVYAFYFHNESNAKLAEALMGRVAILECILQNDTFLAISFYIKGKREPIVTNRRHEAFIDFVYNKRHIAAPLPIDLYTALRALPVAEERSEYVEKRISSWEGFLRVQEINADVEDIETSFREPTINEDFTKLSITCPELSTKNLRKMEGFSASIIGLNGDVGQISKVTPHKKRIEIQLSRKYQNEARQHTINFRKYEQIAFSNFAELSQVRRLRKGFKDLQNGLAANPNLEKILFEERPVVRLTKQQQDFEFHSRLNDYQKEAVIGALTANDLYVIQGPPGTGKTTVISEICTQNAKAGLKTLVASQANLAVDNALGRLLDDPDIRILRYGRTESIEEEGRKFIEENIAEHWKEQTMQNIEQALVDAEATQTTLKATFNKHHDRLHEIKHAEETLNEQITLKKEAEVAYKAYQADIKSFQQQMEKLTLAIEKSKELLEGLQSEEAEIQTQIAQLSEKLSALTVNDEVRQQQTEIKDELALIDNSLSYARLLHEKKALMEQEQQLKMAIESATKEQQRLQIFQEAALGTQKYKAFQQQIDRLQLVLPADLQEQDRELDHLIFKLRENWFGEKKEDWELIEERVKKALVMLEKVLTEQGYLVQAKKRTVRYEMKSREELHQFLDRFAHYLMQPSTKEMFKDRHYSPEKFDALEKLANVYGILHLQLGEIRYTYEKILAQQESIQKAQTVFEGLKQKVLTYIEKYLTELSEKLAADLVVLEQLPQQLSEIESALNKDIQTNRLDQPLDTLESRKAELLAMETAFIEGEKAYEAVKDELANEEEKLHSKRAEITDEKARIETEQQEQITLEERLKQVEVQQQELKELVASTPELEKQQYVKERQQIIEEQTQIEKRLEQFPLRIKMQKMWLNMLVNATEYDLEEIKKMYINHANVIGTTCVASARKDFMENYPTFDVVIIDEVSKATPPELLLPMLKGKKIILVGDHHQLPPLVGQETMEEFLEEIDNPTDKKELASLLQESLFERLFRTLPKQNKTMLAIQYRMHENIMQTISSFYDEGDYQLRCGLENSDVDRAHQLNSTYVKENDHLLWFDIPNEPAFFEAQVPGGTSRYNEAELRQIEKMLMDLDEATEKNIINGQYAEGTKKNVGVISFYGEQVKRIDRLIEHELHLPHLHCRTGSVDKFQGMEMDIIILSFVRNHDKPSGDIGFAQDYRRLNVALSRAKELLMIVGSCDMFTKRPKKQATRDMFAALQQIVEDQGGMRSIAEEVMS